MILADMGGGLALGTSDRPSAKMFAAGGEGSASAEFFCASPVRTVTITPVGTTAMIFAAEGEGSALGHCQGPSSPSYSTCVTCVDECCKRGEGGKVPLKAN
ncbi:hypothetical protein CEUSTIGMA_g9341.t1 [Chlamydomonas eustigma]|uniref:Uncharacterized protein n=1 Tax=Chlamydomonas eustigma TaxID=1157962 RepID=A0A250XFS8_9CHLO|nr:hypothetical protein CEUSTIGMA_g9341.t1 [Chlamydomonas eustigma]|eukprot:GAX81913.1 hypothetical protein CEUSTIGMA_g9341.t1 [Chlamydomonas eustigma]